jgi:hypothetical protein
MRIAAHLVVHPVPKDELSVHDKWDRAGNIRLVREGMPDLELVKFVTAYGGRTEYDVDLSPLIPLLQGACEIRGFIDTWVSPAWKIEFALRFSPCDTLRPPEWVAPLMYTKSFTAEQSDSGGVAVAVNIAQGSQRVLLYYLASGHCTDGRGADEFVPKDNVIYVDDIAVYRYRPWRDDCRLFREINPYTRRWSNGYWSSDYSRSGWCPGDLVAPLVLDLSDHLTPGRHTVRFQVEAVRPTDENDHRGYWRLSSYLLGWTEQEDD